MKIRLPRQEKMKLRSYEVEKFRGSEPHIFKASIYDGAKTPIPLDCQQAK